MLAIWCIGWFARVTLNEKSINHIQGKVLLDQIWNLNGNKEIKIHAKGVISILVWKPVFPLLAEWMQMYLPYKLHIEGGITIACGLHRQGLIVGLLVTKGYQFRVNIWNSTPKII